MRKYKRKFKTNGGATIFIVGGYPDGKPYLRVYGLMGHLGDIDNPGQIETLAVNILRALNSLNLKSIKK